MATQSATPQSLTQAAQLFDTGQGTDNSPQLEVSLNPTEDFGTRIRSISYEAPAFKSAEELRAAFLKAEKGARDAAEKKFKAEGDLILYVAKIQSYTSERGANAHLRKAAGVPAGFERWYTDFSAKYDIGYAFKTIQHKIQQLHGGCEHCGRLAENASEHKKSCVLYRPLIEQADTEEGNGSRNQIDMKAAQNAFLADRHLAMVGLLTNLPKGEGVKPEEIVATLQAEGQHAYEQLDAETAKSIRVPTLVKLPEPGETKLKETINRIAQNYRNHINALGNKLAGMVIDRKSEGETLALAQQIVELYKQSLRRGFFDDKAKQELASLAAASQPKPKKSRKRNKKVEAREIHSDAKPEPDILADLMDEADAKEEAENAKEGQDFQPGQSILLTRGKRTPIQCKVLEVAPKGIHLEGPDGGDKGWISLTEIGRRLVKPASAKEAL